MSNPFSASSQVLQRHLDLFTNKKLVVMGYLDDDYPLTLLEQVSQLHLSCSHHGQYQTLSAKPHSKLSVGFETYPQLSPDTFDAVLLYMPKAKDEAAYLLAATLPQLAADAEIYIVGENRGGVNASPKLLKDYTLACHKVDSARRCSLYFGQRKAQVSAFIESAWQQQFSLNLPQGALRVCSQPGVFNHGKLDIGSQLLLETLPNLSGKVLDFGCGAGIIGAALGLNAQCSPTLLDVSAYATQSAKATLEANQISGTVIASNGLKHVTESFDYIVTNPPFHSGVSTDYAVTEQFLMQAGQYLKQGGSLFLVANSFLQYEALLTKHFSQWEQLVDNRKFKVLRADKL